MKFKKTIFSLTSAAAVVAPVATVVACGSNSSSAVHSASGIYLALDGHDHSENDKSFNEQGFLGIKDYKNSEATVLKPSSPDRDNDFKQMYANADAGSVIVAPGFAHISPLKSAADEIDGKKIVLIDGTVAKPNIISVEFKVEQAAYLAGYSFANSVLDKATKAFASNATADDKKPFDALDAQKDGKIVVSTFGGGQWPTVTGFMAGFKKGFEKAVSVSTATPEVKAHLEFFKFADVKQHFTGSFAAGGAKTIVGDMKAKGVDIVLPVAGPQTKDVLDAGLNAIGVDTAQETLYTGLPGHVIFSILKDIRTATTNGIKVFKDNEKFTNYGSGNFEPGKTTFGDLENHLVGISDGDSDVKTIYENALKDTTLRAEAVAQDTNFTL